MRRDRIEDNPFDMGSGMRKGRKDRNEPIRGQIKTLKIENLSTIEHYIYNTTII